MTRNELFLHDEDHKPRAWLIFQCHYLICFHQEVNQINLSLIDKSDNTGLESF